MPRRRVTRVAAAWDKYLRRTRPQIQHRDLVFDAARPSSGKEDRLASGQKLGPEVIAFPALAVGFVSTLGSPPASATRCSPVADKFVAKMIVPSGPQVAPRDPPPSTRPIGTCSPLIMATFFSSLRPWKNPTHCPSGEMNTPWGAPRPFSAVGSSWFSARTRSWFSPR